MGVVHVKISLSFGKINMKGIRQNSYSTNEKDLPVHKSDLS